MLSIYPISFTNIKLITTTHEFINIKMIVIIKTYGMCVKFLILLYTFVFINLHYYLEMF